MEQHNAVESKPTTQSIINRKCITGSGFYIYFPIYQPISKYASQEEMLQTLTMNRYDVFQHCWHTLRNREWFIDNKYGPEVTNDEGVWRVENYIIFRFGGSQFNNAGTFYTFDLVTNVITEIYRLARSDEVNKDDGQPFVFQNKLYMFIRETDQPLKLCCLSIAEKKLIQVLELDDQSTVPSETEMKAYEERNQLYGFAVKPQNKYRKVLGTISTEDSIFVFFTEPSDQVLIMMQIKFKTAEGTKKNIDIVKTVKEDGNHNITSTILHIKDFYCRKIFHHQGSGQPFHHQGSGQPSHHKGSAYLMGFYDKWSIKENQKTLLYQVNLLTGEIKNILVPGISNHHRDEFLVQDKIVIYNFDNDNPKQVVQTWFQCYDLKTQEWLKEGVKRENIHQHNWISVGPFLFGFSEWTGYRDVGYKIYRYDTLHDQLKESGKSIVKLNGVAGVFGE